MLIGGGLAAPKVASADPLYRMFTGSDRYATATLIAKESYPDRAPVAFLVKGDDYPDAVAAGPLAAALGGPIVITPSRGLNDAARLELERLQPGTVFVVGLPPSLDGQVESALPGVVVRTIRGDDRYHTAALLAEALVELSGPASRIVLAAGDNFPDALSVGPLAAKMGWPILLTPQRGPLPSVTRQEVQALEVTQALRVGTRVALPDTVTSVVDKVGLDRYHTSALVAEYGRGFGLTFGHVALAKGDDYPDALVVGPYLTRTSGTLLLTRQTALPNTTRDALSAHAGEVATLDFVGLGPAIPGAVKGSVWFPFPIEVGDARQVVTVAARGTTATVQAWERRADDSWSPVAGLGPMSAFVGRNGVRADKREGDGATPAGTFSLSLAFGAAANPGTSMPYRVPGSQSYWVSDPASAFYNTWREYDGDRDFDPAFGERLAGSPTAYRYALVVDYNRFPVVPGAGSAIFLHVTLGVPTSGCVSMAQADVVRLLRWLDPAKRPRMAIR